MSRSVLPPIVRTLSGRDPGAAGGKGTAATKGLLRYQSGGSSIDEEGRAEPSQKFLVWRSATAVAASALGVKADQAQQRHGVARRF